MNLTLLKGYPDNIGRRKAFVGSGAGPTSYSQTTKDVLNMPLFGNYFDVVTGAATVSGTYIVRPIPSAASARATWKLTWVVVATGAEVANGIDLSAERVLLSGFMGQY